MHTEATDLAALAQRLQTLEDEKAILETLYRYGHCIDYGREQEWLDCFTEDADFRNEPKRDAVHAEQLRAGHQLQRTGRALLAKFIAGHTRPPERFHKHLLVEPRITLQEDEARVDSYFVRLDAHPHHTGAFIRTFGRYRDTLVRCEDGKWRIRERVAEPDAWVALPRASVTTWPQSASR